MRTMRILLVVLALAACGYDQGAMDRADCSGYGFSPGTTAFAQCMQSVDLNRQDENNAAIGATLGRQGPRSCTTIGGITSCR